MNRPAPKSICVYDEVGDTDMEIELPTRYEVCSRCGGEGTHDHPAFSNGITGEEWYGPEWDDESREDYMRGRYDVICSTCHGLRVEAVVDESALSPATRALWEQWCRDRAEAESERRYQERMGF